MSSQRHKAARRFRNLNAYVAAQPREKSVPDIARELGLTYASLRAYLNGTRYPSRETALRLSPLTGIPLAGLLDPARAEGAA